MFVGKKIRVVVCNEIQNRHYQQYTNSRHFPLSWLFTKLFARVSRGVTILEHLSSSPILSVVNVVPSSVFCEERCGSLFVTCPLYFSHCIYRLCFLNKRNNTILYKCAFNQTLLYIATLNSAHTGVLYRNTIAVVDIKLT